MASETWQNETVSPFAPSGWSQEAQMYHLMGIGKGQFLLAMGGLTSQPLPQQTDRMAVPYDTVSIYDMQTKAWYNQSTSGNIPPGRGSACHLGIQGNNGTYEVGNYTAKYVCLSEIDPFARRYSSMVVGSMQPQPFNQNRTSILTESTSFRSHLSLGTENHERLTMLAALILVKSRGTGK